MEQATERLYFLAKVEEGLRQVNAGQVVSHEEARRRLLDDRAAVKTAGRRERRADPGLRHPWLNPGSCLSAGVS